MLLRAGLTSFALLLASRVLGLLRETLQAATFGANGQADLVILMLTLPDLLTGILAAGAFSYVLLPLWARQTDPTQAKTLIKLTRYVMLFGLFAGGTIALWPQGAAALLAPGLLFTTPPQLPGALYWSALALPLALVAALWTTRLQHQRDFLGMYGANLTVNGTVVGGLLVLWWWVDHTSHSSIMLLGTCLLTGMGLRLLWLRWRMVSNPTPYRPIENLPAAEQQPSWPTASTWLWALASAGLPLVLPLAGRSLASTLGEGALTTFSYAWKLVELPLVLGIQLVASLTFPAMAQAFASAAASSGHTDLARSQALGSSMALAWGLACAMAAAIACTAPALASLLFGWGRMPPDAVAQVAQWGSIGAWSLLPQALLAVLINLMASTGRLRSVVPPYAMALATVCGAALWSHEPLTGTFIMLSINAALGCAAAILLWQARRHLAGCWTWREWLSPLLAAVALAHLVPSTGQAEPLIGLLVAGLVSGTVLLVAWLLSPTWRRVLKR